MIPLTEFNDDSVSWRLLGALCHISVERPSAHTAMASTAGKCAHSEKGNKIPYSGLCAVLSNMKLIQKYCQKCGFDLMPDERVSNTAQLTTVNKALVVWGHT